MASTYTYDDFVSAAEGSGLLSQFSQYDLDLAKQYPEFGMSILSLKQDWGSASTDEAKALINAKANELRSSYGNYTAGADGGGYYANGLSPASYQSAYSDDIADALDKVTNREEFSYDKDSDPSYSAYKKEYLREGQRATADALGQAATLTGGIPSTAAVTAATQAGDYYATKLSDMVPTLYQQAYERYLDEYNMDTNALSALQTQDNTEYSRLLDEVSSQQTQQQLSSSEEQQALENSEVQDQTAYERQQDAFNNAMTILSGGAMPDANLLEEAGISQTTAQALLSAVKAKAAAKTSGSGSGSTSGESDAAKAFKSGDQSDSVIKALLDEGYTQMQIEAAGYTGDYFKNSSSGGNKPSTTPTSSYGTSYSNIWKTARSMKDAGKSDADIMAYLDRFDATQLTDAGLDYIMQHLNISGAREG